MKTTLALVVLGLMATSFYVVADDVAGDAAQATAPSADQISQWVEQLGDARFATRRDATDALVAAGLPAIEPVTNAALEGSAEVAVRCVQVLRRLKDSSETAVVEAATAGLQTLADSENALVNERATAALDESPLDPDPAAQFGQPGAIQIQIQGGVFAAGNFETVETTVNNGQRTVTVNENGKKIEMRDQDGEDIEITVTETVNGEEKTTEYAADDVEDLQQNHPEIAELYEKYTAQNPVVQVFAGQIQQIPFPGIPQQAVPVPFGQNLPFPGQLDDNQQMAEDIGAALDRLASVSAKLAELSAAETPDQEALEGLVEELDAIRQDLADAQDQLND